MRRAPMRRKDSLGLTAATEPEAAASRGLLSTTARWGHFNSAGVANAAYTLRLTVVDRSSNYPEPCQVTINVQN